MAQSGGIGAGFAIFVARRAGISRTRRRACGAARSSSGAKSDGRCAGARRRRPRRVRRRAGRTSDPCRSTAARHRPRHARLLQQRACRRRLRRRNRRQALHGTADQGRRQSFSTREPWGDEPHGAGRTAEFLRPFAILGGNARQTAAKPVRAGTGARRATRQTGVDPRRGLRHFNGRFDVADACRAA